MLSLDESDEVLVDRIDDVEAAVGIELKEKGSELLLDDEDEDSGTESDKADKYIEDENWDTDVIGKGALVVLILPGKDDPTDPTREVASETIGVGGAEDGKLKIGLKLRVTDAVGIDTNGNENTGIETGTRERECIVNVGKTDDGLNKLGVGTGKTLALNDTDGGTADKEKPGADVGRELGGLLPKPKLSPTLAFPGGLVRPEVKGKLTPPEVEPELGPELTTALDGLSGLLENTIALVVVVVVGTKTWVLD